MAEAPNFQQLLKKIDLLKERLESSRTREEKLMILAEFRFLLDAADRVLRDNP